MPPLAKTIERISMRKEHPRPQFVRDSWLNLNGQWTCDYSRRKILLTPGKVIYQNI